MHTRVERGLHTMGQGWHIVAWGLGSHEAHAESSQSTFRRGSVVSREL